MYYHDDKNHSTDNEQRLYDPRFDAMEDRGPDRSFQECDDPYGDRDPDQSFKGFSEPYGAADLHSDEQDGWQPGPNKRKRAGRTAALLLAVAIVSASAGGGAAMWVLDRQTPADTARVSETVLQTTNATGTTYAESGSVASVAAAAADSVVEIDTQVERRSQSFFAGSSLIAGSGSGVIISEDGYIVTNNHVVEGADSILVRTTDGTEYTAQVIGTDAQTDLAVIKVEATGLPAAVFADSDNIQVGDTAVAIGNPLGELGGTVTSGIISATGREVKIDGTTMTLLQTTAAVNPGNSGGGLFDANGNLIGVVNAKSQGVEIEGLGFAIPSNTVKQVAYDIIDKGYVAGRPAMGISVIEINDARTASMYGVSHAGVYVTDPGKNEGLRLGDRLVFVAGESISSTADLSAALNRYSVGETLSVSVVRDGKEVQTEVTLGERLPDAATQAEPLPEPEPAGEL